MSFQHLYNLHSEKLEDFSSSESNDEDNKPPLYTYEELKENLVVYDGRGTRNFEFDLSEQSSDEEESGTKSPNHFMKLKQVTEGKREKDLDEEHSNLQVTTTEQIQQQLTKRLTKTFCYICKKQNDLTQFNRHYNSGNHFNNEPVDIKYLFCQACNLPLDGNDKAKKHYTMAMHLKNSKRFCSVCCKGVLPYNFSTHLSTKKHLQKLEKEKPETTKEDNVVCTTSYAGALKKQDVIIDNKQSVVVIKETTIKTDSNKDNFIKLSDYLNHLKKIEEKVVTPESISIELAKLMENKYCQFCPDVKKFNKKHLNKCHFDNVVQWLENEINPVDLALLFCEVCNLPLSGNNYALKHYETSLHLHAVKTFCRVCWKNFPNTSLQLHNQSNKHLKKSRTDTDNSDNLSSDWNTIIEEEEEEMEQKNQPLKKTSTTTDPKPMKQYKRLATYVLRFLDEKFCYVCNMPVVALQHYQSQQHMQTIRKWLETNYNLLELFGIRDIEELVYPFVLTNNKNPSVLLATNLKILLTPSLCEVCDLEITPNNVFHYKERNHILTIRNWMSYGMQTLQVFVDPRLIYCEACTLILCGTEAARGHYKNVDHLINQPLYCPHCIFKGTQESMLPHFLSPEHRLRFCQSLKLQHEVGIIGKQQLIQIPVSVNNNSMMGQNLFYNGPRPSINQMVVANFMQSMSQRAVSTNAEESQLKMQINREVKRLLELVYCSGKVPLKEAANYLNLLNQKLVSKIRDK
ncbi:unnamed protein product [Ceutorhynchus assimilis]|uniref:U1-type domain-containing protein n=1 Tax=Ceutorhynchus assimilis TaxID=467358 RepID=A0A9N9MCP8_9CUCU|nr:unnamed protein product [Ceutorhynchus assimilis]